MYYSTGILPVKEGNPPRRDTLLEGSPFSIEIPCSVYMIGRVTLGGGLPYLLARVTLPVGTTFGHVNTRRRVTLPGGLSLAVPGYYLKFRDRAIPFRLLAR